MPMPLTGILAIEAHELLIWESSSTKSPSNHERSLVRLSSQYRVLYSVCRQ